MATAKQAKKYNSIVLIPTDFSDICNNAISHGVKLAKFLGYKVCILHIISKETKAELKKKNAGVDYVESRLKEYTTSRNTWSKSIHWRLKVTSLQQSVKSQKASKPT